MSAKKLVSDEIVVSPLGSVHFQLIKDNPQKHL